MLVVITSSHLYWKTSKPSQLSGPFELTRVKGAFRLQGVMERQHEEVKKKSNMNNQRARLYWTGCSRGSGHVVRTLLIPWDELFKASFIRVLETPPQVTLHVITESVGVRVRFLGLGFFWLLLPSCMILGELIHLYSSVSLTAKWRQ